MGITRRKKRKIAVIGYSDCGKTVFLTSLIWRLEKFTKANSEKFKLRDRYDSFKKNTKTNEKRRKFTLFDYLYYRNTLINKEWPKKTYVCSKFSLLASEKKRWYRNATWLLSKLKPAIVFDTKEREIEFIDIPGERISDLLVYKHNNYAEWSEALIEELKQNNINIEEIVDFPDTENNDDRTTHLLNKYKETLAIANAKGFLSISPSSLLLTLDGKKTDEGMPPLPELVTINDKDSLMDKERKDEQNKKNFDIRTEIITSHFRENGILGVDKNSEFCPLPKKYLDENKEIVEVFSENYRKYKDKIDEIFNEIKESNSIVILIDIPYILSHGPKCLDTQIQFLKLVFETLDYSFYGKLSHLRRKRIAIVANKADMIKEFDRYKLIQLLKSMVPNMRINNHFIMKYFYCSPCESIILTKEGNYVGNIREGGTVVFDIPNIPDSWEDEDWKNSHVNYELFRSPEFKVYPRTFDSENIPPDHINLDVIADYILYAGITNKRKR